jgi:hypothetical protein
MYNRHGNHPWYTIRDAVTTHGHSSLDRRKKHTQTEGFLPAYT